MLTEKETILCDLREAHRLIEDAIEAAEKHPGESLAVVGDAIEILTWTAKSISLYTDDSDTVAATTIIPLWLSRHVAAQQGDPIASLSRGAGGFLARKK